MNLPNDPVGMSRFEYQRLRFVLEETARELMGNNETKRDEATVYLIAFLTMHCALCGEELELSPDGHLGSVCPVCHLESPERNN